jgi:hypothetical protein
MNTRVTIFPIIFIATIACSCDTFNTIPLSGNSDTLVHKFDTGILSVYLQVWQGHSFDFYQTFDVRSETCLFPDSLIIEFKGQRFTCSFVAEENNPRFVCFSGRRKIRTAFEIKQHVNKGDTLWVTPAGYLYSAGKKVDFQSLILVIGANLRGPMGS